MRASRTLGELEARFWAKVNKGVADACWEWQGTACRGYGMFWIPAWLDPVPARACGRMDMAHRVAYWLRTGVWPGGMDVCHTCDNPPCVNPSHLWLGTARDNLADAKAKGRLSHQGAPAGEASSLHKLSDNDILVISLRAGGGERQGDIAADFGISQSMVSRIKTGARRRPPLPQW